MQRKFLKLMGIYLSLFAAMTFLFGCSDSTGPATGQGQIMMKMVDAPGDYDQVNIVVTKVEVHSDVADSTSGWVTINNNTSTYDLLSLRNGANAILGDATLDAGHYTQIRLIIGAGSNVVVNGKAYSLDISSGAQTGIKLNHEFDIKDGQVYSLLLDFNAESSIILTGNNQYKLKPVIRVIPEVISGTISGKITPLTVKTTVTASNGIDTFTTVSDTTSGSFKLVALLAGSYNLTFTPAAYANYNDTTKASVLVTAEQNTDIGTINLSSK
ncbi:MAG: DUF4382 domain-containing protein [Ignavibacteriaceae bacterium]